jgi:hypothetical protein
MARYEHLPIFADAYRLALRVDELVEQFPSRARPALGADLRTHSQRMLALIVQANDLRGDDRGNVLRELRWATECFQITLRLAKDRRLLPGLKAYEQCANLAYSVGRQTEGWWRSLERRGPDTATNASAPGASPLAPG